MPVEALANERHENFTRFDGAAVGVHAEDLRCLISLQELTVHRREQLLYRDGLHLQPSFLLQRLFDDLFTQFLVAAASCGRRLVFVIPGSVLISRKYGVPSGVTMKSARE